MSEWMISAGIVCLGFLVFGLGLVGLLLLMKFSAALFPGLAIGLAIIGLFVFMTLLVHDLRGF